MGHYHIIRCPHCDEDDGQVGCGLDTCHFARTSKDLTEFPEITTCQGCDEAYSLDDGCWTGNVPPWKREELGSREAADLIEAAIDLAHKQIGFGEFKEKVRAYEGVKEYRIYKMASGGVTITDWPKLFKSPDAAADWAKERELAEGLGLHEFLAVKDEATEEVVKYL